MRLKIDWKSPIFSEAGLCFVLTCLPFIVYESDP